MSRRQQRRRDDRRRQAKRTGPSKGTIVASAGIAVGAALAAPAASQAATSQTFTVTSTDATTGDCDATPNDCTLPQAVTSANNNAGAVDTIVFASGVTGTINLTAPLVINDSVNIYGPGANLLNVHQTTAGDRVFHTTQSGYADIYYLSITGGGDSTTNGGGILNDGGGGLYLVADTLSDNHGRNGAALNNENGFAGILGSTLTGNTASGDGGAVYTSGDHEYTGATAISASTVSGNTAAGRGGALASYRYAYEYDYAHYGAGGFFYDSTVANNNSGTGGAVSADATSVPYTYYDSGSGYTYYYGGYAVQGPTFFNTIVGENTGSSHDLEVTGDSYGAGTAFSLLQDPAPSTYAGSDSTSIFHQDPQLNALASNGGPTQTHAPSFTSPVLDHGYAYYTSDQRGESRPVDLPTISNGAGSDASDMGAVELQSGPAPTSSPPPPPLPPPVVTQSQSGPVLTFAGAVTAGTNAVTFTVSCGGQPCDGVAKLTTKETLKGGKVVSVARKKTKKKTVTVGSKHFTLAAGQSAKVTVPLNATGKKLLKKFHKLPTQLTVTQNLPGNKHVVVKTAHVQFKAKSKKKHGSHRVIASGTRFQQRHFTPRPALRPATRMAHFFATHPRFRRFAARSNGARGKLRRAGPVPGASRRRVR